MKSHASDLTEVALCVYLDACAKCAAKPDKRDVLTITSRVKEEGLSFLTITLPSFGADFERSLAAGSIDSNLFQGFRKRRAIPAFLSGMLSLIFDMETGRILQDDQSNVATVEGVRQISYTFKKILLPCTAKRIARAFESFKQVEHELQRPIAQGDLERFKAVSRLVWDSVVSSDKLRDYRFIPKHGPGATAERVSGNAKYEFGRWHDRLEGYFPLLSYAFSSESVVDHEDFEKVTIVPEEQEQPVRVITVPKTLKTPRIIAIEPVCMQYAQQAVSQSLVDAIERDRLVGGHVNFTDQSINRRLALMSSEDGRLATLDLSSASDRVTNSVAALMFEANPLLWGCIQACRSKTAELPDGTIIPLVKFASMGSALCFPVEAMYHYTICIVALLEKYNLPVTFDAVRKVGKDVYVYGDDLFVPADAAAVVTDHLQRYNCKVNNAKSFWTGKFRESCGMDAYAGEEVTPIRLKHVPPCEQRDASALISWVASANLFYKKGYWITSSFLFKRVEAILGKLPVVGPNCAGLGKVSFQNLVSAERWNKAYQVCEVRTWCGVPVYQRDRLEGYPALTKCLLALERRRSNDTEPGTRSDHLRRSARHGAVALKRQWVRPY